MLDAELAVRPLHHLDLRTGVASPLGLGQQLERAPAVLDGVVARDGARVPEAEDGREGERGIERAVGHLGLRGRDAGRGDSVETGLTLPTVPAGQQPAISGRSSYPTSITLPTRLLSTTGRCGSSSRRSHESFRRA